MKKRMHGGRNSQATMLGSLGLSGVDEQKLKMLQRHKYFSL
jgi:hypothetical protein